MIQNSRTKPAGPEEELWSFGLAKQVPLQALTTSERIFDTDYVETYEFPYRESSPYPRAAACLHATCSGALERSPSRQPCNEHAGAGHARQIAGHQG
jgi:hypothetical protein